MAEVGIVKHGVGVLLGGAVEGKRDRPCAVSRPVGIDLHEGIFRKGAIVRRICDDSGSIYYVGISQRLDCDRA